MSDLVKRYTSSVFFDKRLWQSDIQGSLAHAEMLSAQKIISAQDLADIQRGMAQITEEIIKGQFDWKLDLEDVHLNIEARLTQIVGDAGKRLHTGRSRNDQVATDVRLWLVSEIDLISELLNDLQKSLIEVAERNVEVILPGFTHLQVAQPVSFAHHLLAYASLMFPAGLRKPCNLLLVGLFFIGWSGAIELIQPYVNRYAEWWDLLANGVGVLSGYCLAWVVNQYLR